MTRILLFSRAAFLLPLFGACSNREAVVFVSRQTPDENSTSSSPTPTGPAPGRTFEGAGGAEPTPNSIPCSHHGDCPSTWFCGKSVCGAPLGFCEPPPVFCNTEPDPVCGCGGITFWNDCVRRQNRASASAPGECQVTAALCDTTEDCGVPSARCARLLFPGQPCPGPDAPAFSGTCWAIPDNCSDLDNGQRWSVCPKSPPGPFSGCVDTCDAITSELPHLGGSPICGPF